MMLELAKQNIYSVPFVVEKMCHAPARLFAVKKRGFIRKGYYADLVLINPAIQYTVTPFNILYKCGWSPLEDFTFSNTIQSTFVNGNMVFDGQSVSDTIKGEKLEFER